MVRKIVLKELDDILLLGLLSTFNIGLVAFSGDGSDESDVLVSLLLKIAVHGVIHWPPYPHPLLPAMHSCFINAHYFSFILHGRENPHDEVLLFQQLILLWSPHGEVILGGQEPNAVIPVHIAQSVLVDAHLPVTIDPFAPLIQIEAHEPVQQTLAQQLLQLPILEMLLLLLSIAVLPQLESILLVSTANTKDGEQFHS